MFGAPSPDARTSRHFARRAFGLFGILAAFVVALSCARSGGSLRVVAAADHPSGKPVIRVSGLLPPDVEDPEQGGRVNPSGPPVLTVRVADAPADAPPIAGQLVVEGGDLVFIPMFGLDPGREYRVEIDGATLSGRRAGAPTSFVVGLPALESRPSTVVTRVLPSADEWPENTLRFYVEFSAPMSRTGGLEYVRLLDETGKEVVDPFLPLDVEFWNPEHTRYTFFFDPGRVKRDILPNREMGRALVAGRTYTLEVSAAWRDGAGQPLAGPYRRTFRAGPMDEDAVDPIAWTLEPPAPGTRDAVLVRFPSPLDHGLLTRAVGVRAPDGRFPTGEVTIGDGELSWQFRPDTPWVAGRYEIVVLSILEDAAGNRVGRPFEVDEFTRVDEAAAPEQTVLPFVIRAAR